MEPTWATVSPREQRIVLHPKSWHNKTGEIIRRLDENIWVIERGYIFLGRIDVGGRTTIIKLSDGGLFVHAPLALTKELKEDIDAIGLVTVVIAPNTEHVDFINQWKKFYPHAAYFGPPGSMRKLPNVQFTTELSRDSEPDPMWEEDGICQFFISTAPFFNETVFVHTPSKTLLCTDLYWSYPTDSDVPRNTKLWAFAMNKVYKPVYDKVLVKSKSEFKLFLQALLDTGFEKIIPCHGDIIEERGQQILTGFFRKML